MKLWIDYIDENKAEGKLAEFYEQIRQDSPNGSVPDMVKVLSIRPELAIAKDNLRHAVLGESSSLGARRADMISVVVSGMNDCQF